MPAVIAGAAVSALVAGSTLTAGVLTIGFSLASFAGSMILGGLSYALTPKPKKPNLGGGLSGQNVSVRQPDITRAELYGHMRITKGFAHMEATETNGKLHLILMLCDGPVRAINEVWADDYAIPNDWIDADGNVTQGRYANNMVIRKHLGANDQMADSLAVANLSNWSSAHRLQGIAYLYIILNKNQDVYPNGVPNFSAVVEGKELYDPRTEETSWTSNIALFAADYLRDSDYGFNVFDTDIDFTNIAAQANICDEIVDTEFLDSNFVSVDPATDIITLTGDFIKYEFGDRVQVIVNSGTIPGGLATSTNYYVIPYQVKDTPRLLLATTFNNALKKIPVNITSTGSGSFTLRKTGEPRYHGAGVIERDVNLSENLNNIVNSMAGRAVNIGGFWTLLAGAWRTPFMSLDIGDIRGSGIGVKNALTMSESYNVIKGLYISAINSYQPTDYPTTFYQEFIDDDNGLESPKELNLPFTNRPTTAQRIGKIELFRGRQDIVFNADFSMKALALQPGDTVELNIERLGWDGKEFEVTEFTFDVNDGAPVIRLSLRETAEAIYDWTSGEAIDYDPAPNSNLPNPFNVSVVTGVGYDSIAIETQDADNVFKLTLNWDLHPDAFVREFGDFEVQYKLSAETEWRPSFFVDGQLTKTDVVTASVNTMYDVRIRARNNLGVRSSWQTIYNAIVGYSGGVVITEDWGLVTDTPAAVIEDYGLVIDTPPTYFIDRGFIF